MNKDVKFEGAPHNVHLQCTRRGAPPGTLPITEAGGLETALFPESRQVASLSERTECRELQTSVSLVKRMGARVHVLLRCAA